MNVIPDFISHYYEKENGPLRSLSDTTKEKSTEILKNIISKGEGFNSKRTLDYIEIRNKVEEWLRNEFINRGGKPKRKNPHYFILGECDWLLSWYKKGELLKIDLTTVNPDIISITYPDSMISYQFMQFKKDPSMEEFNGKNERNYHGKLFLFKELEGLVKQYGMPVGRKESGDFDLYIEFQIWEDI